MSWRCLFLYSLPIALVYVASFFLPAWEDHDGIYAGYETIGRGFEVARGGDVLSLMLLALPNSLLCTGIVLLAVPKTWARIVAALLGLFALLASLLLMICVGVLSFSIALFGTNAGPGQAHAGFFVWIGSMFLLLLMGMMTAIFSGTRERPLSRTRFAEERWRRDPDLGSR